MFVYVLCMPCIIIALFAYRCNLGAIVTLDIKRQLILSYLILNCFCQAGALLRWTFFDGAALLAIIYGPLPLHADRC